MCNKLFLFVAVALAFMMAFSPEVISILAPSEYYDAVYVIPPLAISLYFMFMYQIFANVEFYFEKNKFIMLASIFSAGFNVFLNYIFIKELGYIAAGYTTLVCYVILGISHYIFSDKVAKKCIKDNIHLFDIKIVIGISCILMIFGLIMLLLYKNLLLRYGLILIMCMIFFFILFMTISSCFPFAYSFCVYALIIALCSIVALMPICTKQLVCGSVLMMYRIVYQKMQYYSNMRICMDYRTS